MAAALRGSGYAGSDKKACVDSHTIARPATLESNPLRALWQLEICRADHVHLYIATDEGWLFLAVMSDLFSRQVVGWSLRADMTRDIVIDALRMAWLKRHPVKHSGLLFHSNRGSQFRQQGLQGRVN